MRLTSRINQTKEEIKVMTMVYIWEENKVLIGMRKRKADNEEKEDWKLDFNYNQVSIIDFEFKKKKQNNLEENMIARKWQLAELDAETPECFNISDVPYNKMW